MFLECRKTFMGKIKYFFKGKKKKKEENNEETNNANKNRMKDILEQDKEESTHYNDEIYTRKYTVEDIIKIGSQLNENNKENKNAKLDLEALKNKVENLERN